jgi:uncharacterized membrane protein
MTLTDLLEKAAALAIANHGHWSSMLKDTDARPMPDEDRDVTVEAEASASQADPVTKSNTEDSLIGRDISVALHGIGAVAGQATLVAALLFYFGWARTQALMGFFGINSSIAHISFSDYILRSPYIAIRMLVIIGILALVLLFGHRRLSTALAAQQHPSIARRAILACIVSGLLLCIAGFLGFYNWVIYSSTYPIVPILFAIGITLVGYGFYIRGFAEPKPRPHGWSAQAQTVTIVVLNIAFLFWVVSVYASINGQQAAEVLASNLRAQPSIVVYSERSLGLTANGVKVQQLPGNDSQYSYQYSNLRLLFYANGQYFLVSSSWRRGRDPVFLIDESNDIRFEFYPGS